MNATHFEVCWTVNVDHPELRGATFRPVAPGTVVHLSKTLPGGEALRFFAALVSGEDDFGSEFVSKAYVIRRYENVSRSPRYVRKPVERSR